MSKEKRGLFGLFGSRPKEEEESQMTPESASQEVAEEIEEAIEEAVEAGEEAVEERSVGEPTEEPAEDLAQALEREVEEKPEEEVEEEQMKAEEENVMEEGTVEDTHKESRAQAEEPSGMGNFPFTREQMQAAYALNLCTVSVSQILAYNDIGVLDQEYETILNNLNFENMPKDEALLQILKRILETITYFRITEGDKEFIEKEYQQKMKNAIWTAVPNLALLVAGANPVSMGVSLAAQVGIGYMNYRKNRSTYALEKDRQMWKLQKSAMEQLEGLSQQLFETAWRLADVYQFPDAFRLSQRQIRQYNSILMDQDEVRKYERLESMKNQFAAYPPFWYYFGNAANAIASNEDLGLDEMQRQMYRDQAKKYFEYFCQSGSADLLREDEITAAACLEYADLLDPVKEKDKILSLVDRAASHAGSFWDVHQLCAMAYLRNDALQKAEGELRLLVNEEYNTVVNAQLLSAIYSREFVDGIGTREAVQAKTRFSLLSTRVGSEFLFPLNKVAQQLAANRLLGGGHGEVALGDPGQFQTTFLQEQRTVLKKMYNLVFQGFKEKYEIQFNKLVPLPRAEYFGGSLNDESLSTEEDSLYLDTPEARKERMNRVTLALGNKNVADAYRQEIYALPYTYQVMGLLNRMFTSAISLECVQDELAKDELLTEIKKSLHGMRAQLQEVEQGLKAFDEEAYRKAQEVTLAKVTGDFFPMLKTRMEESVATKDEMVDFAIAESALMRFCNEEGLEAPDILYVTRHDVEEGEKQELYITPDILGETTIKESKRQERNALMISAIKEAIDKVVVSKDLVEFYTQEDARMNRYFYNKALQSYTGVRFRTLAVLDDRSKSDCDLMFTTEGVIPVIRGKVRNPLAYGEITWTSNTKKKELKIGNVKYSSEHLDMDMLYELICTLGEYARKA